MGTRRLSVFKYKLRSFLFLYFQSYFEKQLSYLICFIFFNILKLFYCDDIKNKVFKIKNLFSSIFSRNFISR